MILMIVPAGKSVGRMNVSIQPYLEKDDIRHRCWQRAGISNQPEAAPSAPLLERGQVAGSIMHANELQDCMKIFLVNQ